MRTALLIAAALAALPAGAARAGGDGPVAGAPDRDDAFAQAVEAPAPRTVVVTGRRPAPSPRDKLIVASTAPDRVFEEDEEGARIDDFINGPIQPGRPGEGQPPPCDETPHGEVGAEYGGGSHGHGGGGYGTVALPVAHCHGLVVLSVSGERYTGGRRY